MLSEAQSQGLREALIESSEAVTDMLVRINVAEAKATVPTDHKALDVRPSSNGVLLLDNH